MSVREKEVFAKCAGFCEKQDAVMVLGKDFYVTFWALLDTVVHLRKEKWVPEFDHLLAALIPLQESLSKIIGIPREPVSKETAKLIVSAIKQYQGPCDVVFFMRGPEGEEVRGITLAEFIVFYSNKAQKYAGQPKALEYQARVRQAADVQRLVERLHTALLEARMPLSPEQKAGEEKVARAERARRGYDLAPEERVRQNIEFLRAGFRNVEHLRDIFGQMTMGRYFYVPGMYQSHVVLAVDTLTGMLLVPRSLKRMASFVHAAYEQQEKDAVTLDYVFARPQSNKPEVLLLPPGYVVLPLRFILPDKDDLSAEAQDVLKKTEQGLFLPVLALLGEAREHKMDPKLLEALEKLYRHIGPKN